MDVLDRSQLSPDTQATLLLCGRFDARPGGTGELAGPLSSAEYLRLAKALVARDRRPADLVGGDLSEASNTGLGEDRLRALLQRGMAMALALERWERAGIRVLGRGDPGYPAKLRKRLRGAAPHLLFVCGPSELLDAEALCIVGSRDATEDGIQAARDLGRACAAERVGVVSGGARGVDREAMGAAIEDGGRSIGVLSDSLAKAVLSKDYRRAIAEGRLVLASAADPDARFTVSGAMDRNKYLYTLAKAAVVVDSDVRGGTWSGAVENAEHRWVPAYVRLHGKTRSGNNRLADLGLFPLPEGAADQPGWVRQLLDEPPPAPDPAQAALPLSPDAGGSPGRTEEAGDGDPQPDAAEDLFNTFVTKTLAVLRSETRSEHQLADYFGIERAQAKRWLEKAVERHLIRREGQGRPALYGAPARPFEVRVTIPPPVAGARRDGP